MSKAQEIQIMGYFSTEQRPLVTDFLNVVFQLFNGATNNDKSAGTLCSRRLHFIHFCKEKRLMEIFSIRKKGKQPIQHRKLHYVMAMYAFELASGSTIQGIKIKSSTIKDYLLAAATLISRFDVLGRDARKELNCEKLCEANSNNPTEIEVAGT